MGGVLRLWGVGIWGRGEGMGLIINLMIGSLRQFLHVDATLPPQQSERSDRMENGTSHSKLPRRRIHSTFDHYIPQDKGDLLRRYERSSLNRKKFTSIPQEAGGLDRKRKPLYEHRSFFVKADVGKDQIAKDGLKRKHNLLRAMVRMKQNEEEPKGESDYEQSFQRLYAGFKAVKPQPVISHYHEQHHEEVELVSEKSVAAPPPRTISSLSHRKRLEYENCLSWARKHQKNGEFFARELGKYNKNEHRAAPVVSRSLIDEIGKKIEVTWLD